jgi:hypothetical protein
VASTLLENKKAQILLDKKQLGVETNWGVERRVETNVSIGD